MPQFHQSPTNFCNLIRIHLFPFTSHPHKQQSFHNSQTRLMHIINGKSFDHINVQSTKWGHSTVVPFLIMCPKRQICSQYNIICICICYFLYLCSPLVTHIAPGVLFDTFYHRPGRDITHNIFQFNLNNFIFKLDALVHNLIYIPDCIMKKFQICSLLLPNVRATGKICIGSFRIAHKICHADLVLLLIFLQIFQNLTSHSKITIFHARMHLCCYIYGSFSNVLTVVGIVWCPCFLNNLSRASTALCFIRNWFVHAARSSVKEVLFSFS